ncbi:MULTISPECIES: methyltransferase family protein [unclassified Psychrobacter]|uniref:methyltransferase family protein n=1 Tax=unclassified Psychrobacter TaxID=196806 RepID=UPI003FD52692
MRFLELKVPPVVQVVVSAAAMYGVSKVAPNLQFSIEGSTMIAVGLGAIGLGLGVLGVAQFKKAQTTPNPQALEKASSLVTSGIYRYTRNPMYVGLTLVLLGWAFYLSHYLAFIILPVFVIYMTRFQIEPEERAMTRLFGTAYQSYRAKVRRWI